MPTTDHPAAVTTGGHRGRRGVSRAAFFVAQCIIFFLT